MTLLVDGGFIRGLLLGRDEPLAVLLLQTVWFFEQLADLVPGGGVQPIRAHLRVQADPHTAESIRIRSQATVVRIVAARPRRSTG